MSVFALLITCPILAMSQICPGLYEGTPIDQQAPVPPLDMYNAALKTLNILNVINDIDQLLTDSQECWPADSFGAHGSSYGPLFVRLTWHCSGSFRSTDGVGGCSGGRQRFGPEASWPDNTNLDKARALLAPIKNKYGIALSWGDLLTFAGTAALLNMGGPVSEICAGRVDSENGELSYSLGPGPEQPDCPVQGDCPPPLGADTVGLIYVNPEGFMGVPDPARSAEQIRTIFARMDMDDRQTVALIGGGHAFGKCHGACPAGAGAPPNLSPLNPWPGNCGSGKGVDTFTSGFEGQWTSNPFVWDNEFFKRLIEDEYEVITGPGGKYQWNNTENNLIMLTSDLALFYDTEYRQIVQEFAEDITALNKAFADAWAILTTNGGEWAEERFCIDGFFNNTNYRKRQRKYEKKNHFMH